MIRLHQARERLVPGTFDPARGGVLERFSFVEQEAIAGAVVGGGTPAREHLLPRKPRPPIGLVQRGFQGNRLVAQPVSGKVDAGGIRRVHHKVQMSRFLIRTWAPNAERGILEQVGRQRLGQQRRAPQQDEAPEPVLGGQRWHRMAIHRLPTSLLIAKLDRSDDARVSQQRDLSIRIVGQSVMEWSPGAVDPQRGQRAAR